MSRLDRDLQSSTSLAWRELQQRVADDIANNRGHITAPNPCTYRTLAERTKLLLWWHRTERKRA